MVWTALFAAIAVALIAFIVSRLLGPDGALDRKKKIEKRLSTSAPYLSDFTEAATLKKTYRMSDVKALAPLLGKVDSAKEIALMLEAARWNISVGTFMLICAVSGGLTFCVLLLTHAHWAAAIAIGAFATYAPLMMLLRKRKQYIERFSAALPETLSMLANAIRAGQGIESAISVVAMNGTYPIADEFRKMQAEIKLGLSLNDALMNLYRRVQSDEFKIFVTGVSINQELGGNLSEILQNLEKTLRERFALKREIVAISAQGVLSGRVITAIPIVISTFWYFSQKALFTKFLASTIGHICLGLSICLIVTGYLWVNRIVQLRD